MRDLGIGSLSGLGLFAAGAIVSALAIKYSTDSLLWDIILWGGILVMALSAGNIILMIIYYASNSSLRILRPRVGPVLLVNIAICLIVASIVWHFSEAKPPSQARTAAAPSVLLLPEPGQLRLHNKNDYELQLWGSRFDTESPRIETEARIIPVGSYYYFLTDKLEKHSLARIGASGEGIFAFEAYLATPNQDRFTSRFYLLVKMANGSLTVHTQQLGTSEGGWDHLR
jgi:hypothetical protein